MIVIVGETHDDVLYFDSILYNLIISQSSAPSREFENPTRMCYSMVCSSLACCGAQRNPRTEKEDRPWPPNRWRWVSPKTVISSTRTAFTHCATAPCRRISTAAAGSQPSICCARSGAGGRTRRFCGNWRGCISGTCRDRR